MTDSSSPLRLPIGIADGVQFDVVAWGPAQADVDVSVACMFEHEVGDAGISGGLLGLHQALGDYLSRSRCNGAFRAQEMETLLITLPPPGMAPPPVLKHCTFDVGAPRAAAAAQAFGAAFQSLN